MENRKEEEEGKRVEGGVGRQEGGGGRAEEGDGRERVRGNENNTCAHLAFVLQFLLTKVVVASPSSPTMSPSLDCCVVWRWEINEES